MGAGIHVRAGIRCGSLGVGDADGLGVDGADESSVGRIAQAAPLGRPGQALGCDGDAITAIPPSLAQQGKLQGKIYALGTHDMLGKE